MYRRQEFGKQGMPAIEIMLNISKFVERSRTDFFKLPNILGLCSLERKKGKKGRKKRRKEGEEKGRKRIQIK
jgi:hypothetical protein